MPKLRSSKLVQHFVLDRWLDILKDEPSRMLDAPILHHYTDAFGVEGIVSSNVLWADGDAILQRPLRNQIFSFGR